MVPIQLNGESKQVEDGLTLTKLLETLSVNQYTVAVERNEIVVRRAELGTTKIEPGDRIEIVRILGGG